MISFWSVLVGLVIGVFCGAALAAEYLTRYPLQRGDGQERRRCK